MYSQADFSFSITQLILAIPPSYLWISALIVLGLVILATLALVFHWYEYRQKSPATAFAEMMYFLGLVVFGLLGFGSLSLALM
jgi:hypothetical protein